MMMEVRSDFTVALRIKSPDGKVRTLASHHAETRDMEDGFGATNPVPHLHRLSPDGAWLASYDPDDGRMFLTSVGAVQADHSFEIEGVDARVRQFRWTDDGRSFVISGTREVWVAPIPWATGADAKVQAEPVLAGLRAPEAGSVFQVLDLRRAPGGFFVRVRDEGAEVWGQQQVFHARVFDGTVQELNAVVPEGLTTDAAIVASGGELVVAVAYAERDYFTERTDPLENDGGELWRFSLDAEAGPQYLGRMPCPEDYCYMSNWAPGSSPLVAVHGYDRIVSYTDPEHPTLHTYAEGEDRMVDSLWAWPEGGWLASNGQSVRSFDEEANLLWSWTPKGDRLVHGVHVAEGGQTALVAAGLDLYRVQAGKARRIVRARGKHPRARHDADIWEGTKQSFIDQAIELPDGSIAYTVVDLEQSYEEPHWGEEVDPKIFEAVPFDDDVLQQLDAAPVQQAED